MQLVVLVIRVLVGVTPTLPGIAYVCVISGASPP